MEVFKIQIITKDLENTSIKTNNYHTKINENKRVSNITHNLSKQTLTIYTNNLYVYDTHFGNKYLNNI